MTSPSDASDHPKPVVEPSPVPADPVTRALRQRIRQQEILAELGVVALQGKRRKEETAKRRAEMIAADAIAEDEPSNIEPSPVIDIVVEDVKAEPQVINIDIVKNGTQSAAPEIISPTFTTKGAVNQNALR